LFINILELSLHFLEIKHDLRSLVQVDQIDVVVVVFDQIVTFAAEVERQVHDFDWVGGVVEELLPHSQSDLLAYVGYIVLDVNLMHFYATYVQLNATP